MIHSQINQMIHSKINLDVLHYIAEHLDARSALRFFTSCKTLYSLYKDDKRAFDRLLMRKMLNELQLSKVTNNIMQYLRNFPEQKELVYTEVLSLYRVYHVKNKVLDNRHFCYLSFLAGMNTTNTVLFQEIFTEHFVLTNATHVTKQLCYLEYLVLKCLTQPQCTDKAIFLINYFLMKNCFPKLSEENSKFFMHILTNAIGMTTEESFYTDVVRLIEKYRVKIEYPRLICECMSKDNFEALRVFHQALKHYNSVAEYKLYVTVSPGIFKDLVLKQARCLQYVIDELLGPAVKLNKYQEAFKVT